MKSAAVLGIDEDRVTIVDDRGLPDDPSVEWNENLIGNYIVEAVSRHGAKTVSTNDRVSSIATVTQKKLTNCVCRLLALLVHVIEQRCTF